ncbi:HTH-type transcriptional repressor YvoA [Streptomyces sp. RB5]|uniref:HTH-type transcriptional repressor YvoA n=1 Tax=Streptomyces smaragdinus TaxID=2585196 RepID=A0A7K0CLK5_9ACTN|nr:GntR family transcriptional regulator [Streptomyces smaragdinus]MQY14367.1 HTH-type transcriptional repressor YvoA [Streptomyces smaragdinus]
MVTLKYEQIADSIRARITEGELPPGALIPSQRELCEQWGVSRATSIKAMDVLRLDGLIDRERQGQGFRVAETPVARPAGGRGASTYRIEGAHPFRRVGRPERMVPPPEVRHALRLADEAVALRRDRVLLLDDGTPLTFVSAWFPADVADACPRLGATGPLAEGTTRYVARQTERSPARAVDTTTVRLATTDEAGHLSVELPCPVAVSMHTTYDADGRPLVCEMGVTSGQLWERAEEYPMVG